MSLRRRLACSTSTLLLAASLLLTPVGGGLPAAFAENPVTPGDFTGQGFDTCVAPTQASMDAWLASPYRAVGIYISGDSRACRVQPNLSPTWVSTQLAKGWRLLPIALGPQASCLSRFPRYSDDFKIDPTPGTDGLYQLARAQGLVEADKNANDAAAYGITAGSTIWYDLEAFDLTNTDCRESALNFIHGWTTQMRARGYVPGMYSSAASGIKMVDDARRLRPGQFSLPDRIWIARWDGLLNTSTTYIPEDGWRPGNRMKQYMGGHKETWGGVTINIDSNYLELGASAPTPTPSPTVAPTPTPPPLPAPPAKEVWCGGVKVNFWVYPKLSVRQAPRSRVKALQCLLSTRGDYRGTISGRFNKKTQAAVRNWRVSAGLGKGAWMNQKHWVALLSAGTTPILDLGATGADVFRLQRALNASGHAKLGGNGLYDASTQAAVSAYATAVGLPASTITTPEVWAALQTGKV